MTHAPLMSVPDAPPPGLPFGPQDRDDAALWAVEAQYQGLLAHLTGQLAEAAEKTLQQRDEITALQAELALREEGSPVRLAVLERALSQARAGLRLAEQSHAALQKHASALVERAGAQQERAGALQERAARLEQDLAAARQRAEDSEARYAAIVASTSWKITRPMRVLIRLLRRAR